MVTLNNYKEQTKSFDFNNFQHLKQGHDVVIDNLDLYEYDEEIKHFIDTHISLMNEASNYQAEKDKTAEAHYEASNVPETKGKASTPASKKLKKEAKKSQPSKTAKSSKPFKAKSTPKMVEKIAPEITLLRRFIRMVNKALPVDKFVLLVNAMDRAMVEKVIRKTSAHAEVIKAIESKLRQAVNNALEKGDKEIQVNVPEDKLNLWVSMAGGEAVYPSVRIIKRFISIQGKTVDPIKVKALKEAIAKAKVDKEDPYFKQVDAISKAIAKKVKKIKITAQQLNGLSCIAKTCGCNHISGLSGFGEPGEGNTSEVKNNSLEVAKSFNYDGFLRADQKEMAKPAGTFVAPGEIGKFLQNLQPYKLLILLTGDPHAGKTEAVTQIMDSFASMGKRVAGFFLEQGGLESKDTRGAINRNVAKKNEHNIFITGEADKGIKSVKQAAEQFDVVVLDSWQKLGLPNTEMDSLRHEHPNTIFVVIFQQNGKGGTRGGVSADFDAPVQLKVHKEDTTFVNNWIELKKNRGNSLNFHYKISEKKTYPGNQPG